jgi:2Fe-2S ferredoxin
MPTLIFERTRFTVDCPEGGRIVDVCDEHIMAGIPFSCRHANCGTCRVAITEGLEFCEEPDDDELQLSDVFKDPPHVRLACQSAPVARRHFTRSRDRGSPSRETRRP